MIKLQNALKKCSDQPDILIKPNIQTDIKKIVKNRLGIDADDISTIDTLLKFTNFLVDLIKLHYQVEEAFNRGSRWEQLTNIQKSLEYYKNKTETLLPCTSEIIAKCMGDHDSICTNLPILLNLIEEYFIQWREYEQLILEDPWFSKRR